MANIRLNTFKEIIDEFHDSELPAFFSRDLKVDLDINKVMVVYGPRRAGKTFYCYQLISELLAHGINKERILYVNFEDDRLLPLEVKDLRYLLDAYYEKYPQNQNQLIYLFLDEIQSIPGWEVFVRRIYDKEQVRIIVTGSSSQLLVKDIASSIRGRTIRYSVYPLSFREYLRFNGLNLKDDYKESKQRYEIKNLLEKFIMNGRFPETIQENTILRESTLQEYFDLLVYRDLADKFSIKNTDLLKYLLKFLFTNMAKEFSVNSYYKSIKDQMSVSKETINDYLAHIQETSYFWLLPKFSYSLKEQRVNTKKIITIDNGLRNRACFHISADYGRLIENLVGAGLCEQYTDVYYWKNGSEVDFVTNDRNYLQAINVTSEEGDAEVFKREIKGLTAFKEHFPETQKLILITKETEGREGDIELIPLWHWLLRSHSC